MSRDPWYESDSQVRWFAGIWGWVVASIVMILLISGLLLATGTVTAPWVGRAKAYQKQQSGDNRVFAQQQFHDLYQDYQATLAKLPTYHAAAAQGDYQASTNLTGLIAHCTDVVGQYNAAASKYLTAQFRDANLPPTLDFGECR